MFNREKTFESFVVGSNNQLACAAANVVAETPGKGHNPLLLCGKVGLGKTHLLHAIGQRILKNRKRAKVASLSAEQLANEFIKAVRNNQIGDLRRKYLQFDVLLIDEIQYLSGKERLQEEFFHLFNRLCQDHIQVVMTCDLPAREIKEIKSCLVSRFESGLAASIRGKSRLSLKPTP